MQGQGDKRQTQAHQQRQGLVLRPETKGGTSGENAEGASKGTGITWGCEGLFYPCKPAAGGEVWFSWTACGGMEGCPVPPGPWSHSRSPPST